MTLPYCQSKQDMLVLVEMFLTLGIDRGIGRASRARALLTFEH